MSEFPREGIILDACCIINLYASGYMRDILESIPKQVAIAAYVHDEEAHRIYIGPADDPTREAELISLVPFIEDGLLQVVSLENEAEQNAAINFSFAAALDNGEAITAAIAVLREWSLATDDKSATSFFTRNTPQLHLISTPDILKYWADTKYSHMFIGAALENIESRARYRPHKKHYLYGWWKDFKGKNNFMM